MSDYAVRYVKTGPGRCIVYPRLTSSLTGLCVGGWTRYEVG